MLNRVFLYAQPHARARARIGAMPAMAQWQHIAAAHDLDTMIQRMRDSGLARWVAHLPRSPDVAAIERTLRRDAVELIEDVCRWLPAHWRAAKKWMRSGLSVALIHDLLRDDADDIPELAQGAFSHIAAQPMGMRRDALHAAGYARFMEQDYTLALDRWLEEFDTVCPRLSAREAYAVERIKRLLGNHRAAVLNARRMARQAESDQTADYSAQWRLREQLSRQLRDLLGYESFHAGLLFVYALLELLQVERCRALLLARVHDWDSMGIV